jgi:hypothetical protein
MAETTADVRRDIELTRERMSDTLAQLERKLNVMQTARDHPWASLAVAAGAGFLLARSGADSKAAAATAAAAGGAGSKLGGLLDDAASRLINGVSTAFTQRVDDWVDELKTAMQAPAERTRVADRSPADWRGSRSGDDGRYVATDRQVERPVSRGDSMDPRKG